MKNSKILSYSNYNFIFLPLLLNQFKVKMNVTFFIENDILNILIKLLVFLGHPVYIQFLILR